MSISNLQAKINRLCAQKAAIETKLKQQQLQQRKNRTRTLIQAGGLLKSLGFFEFCQIEDGDDLQFEDLDKATTLAGLLASIELDQDIETLKEKGRKVLKRL